MIDLHSHTTASDGQHTPSELVRLAAEAGVTHLAITDHDTVAGIPEGMDAAPARGLTLIPGIELSAFVGDREVHILGHFIRPDHDELGKLSDERDSEAGLPRLRRLRRHRAVLFIGRVPWCFPDRRHIGKSGPCSLGKASLFDQTIIAVRQTREICSQVIDFALILIAASPDRTGVSAISQYLAAAGNWRPSQAVWRSSAARARSTETSCETPRSAIVTPNRRSTRAIVMR